MNMLQHFRTWISRRGGLVLLIIVVVFLWLFDTWAQTPQPRTSHVLGSSTQHIDVLWFKQEIFRQTTSNGGTMVFMMPLGQDSMMAIDVKNANTIWKVELPFERSGARGMLADKNTIYTVDSTRADAYETETGKLKWSTRLGDGHVSVIPQLDSGVLRIYLGDQLVELNPETGEILSTISKDATIWISDNVTLQTSSNKRVTALDRQSGELIWTNDRLFYIDEGQEPINIGNHNLIVGFVKGICALNLRSGEYSWCHPEIYISDVAIDYQSQIGYAMTEDLVLLTIDLKTGNVLGEAKFLSSQPIDKQRGSMSSITFSNEVLIISFSDSAQTFGLWMNQSSNIQRPEIIP